jgi:hypothetical protein
MRVMPPNSGSRKVPSGALAPRACRYMAARRHPGEVAARRRGRITRTKVVRHPKLGPFGMCDSS